MAIQIDVQACIATPKLLGCLCAQMNQPHLCVVPPSTPSPRDLTSRRRRADGALDVDDDAPPTPSPRETSRRGDGGLIEAGLKSTRDAENKRAREPRVRRAREPGARGTFQFRCLEEGQS